MRVLGDLLVPQTIDVTCDICGKSCRMEGHGRHASYEYASLAVGWGYYSNKDGEQHDCEMCEGCYDKVAAFIVSIGGKIRIETYE